MSKSRQMASVLALGLCATALAHADSGAAGTSVHTAAAVQVSGFRVDGVVDHPDAGISGQRVQQVADDALAALRKGSRQPARLTFAQLQQVADAVTACYRQAGFLVATAIIPVQDIGADGIVHLQVVEGRVGRVSVEGDSRYAASVLASSSRALPGQPLRSRELDSALLYARDLPGVSVSTLLRPGAQPGETDVVLVAHDTRRPLQVSLGANNAGTESTGRGRAQLGISWDSPLGLGDVFAASYTYAFDPEQSRMWAFSYAVPVLPVAGLSVLAGASRGELEVRNGPLAALGLSGPSSQQYLGADWKFTNTEALQATASARYLREKSRVDALGFALSNEKIDVVELGVTLRQVDRRFDGVNLLQLSARQAVADNSIAPDYIAGAYESYFRVARLTLARMQALTSTQRLYLRLQGQYSRDALVPMEQFGIGGADSVRAYPLSDAMGDRGYYGALEYEVDAPGFATHPSPFRGTPWGELLSFNLFVDQGHTEAAGTHRGLIDNHTLAGVGAGIRFRLPQFHHLQLRLSGALPTSSQTASDDRNARVYADIGMTF